jgi:predicted nucleic acid-binding protein
LKKFAREGCEVLIAYPILLEGYSLLLKRLGKSAAGDWLAEVSNSSFVNPTSEDYSRAFVRIRALADQSITLVDATVAALADRLRLPVWTYDHHFDVMRVSVWR